ncbi:DUF4190 domain-containing protein [Nonomuraea phyllanthi]|uniref:DUF4190 domain-containing protein n=1 Tax=Nonomuraea phyllanthi TaxID=2219224 RepID=A0A5C4W914_9ACTN|nr:DUF4190 domain-containing protein [Nonomuraea phyllanthi]KAB8192384.1 DUF4190 domain-containing protein [Nonomuraea phyllanthi]
MCLLALCEFLYEAYAGRRAAALYPSHPGYTGHAPASFRYAGARWNGFAIASLALAMVCWPVSVVFAVLALRQVRETGERGAGLAWASLATTAAFFLFMCVVLVARSGWWAP